MLFEVKSAFTEGTPYLPGDMVDVTNSGGRIALKNLTSGCSTLVGKRTYDVIRNKLGPKTEVVEETV